MGKPVVPSAFLEYHRKRVQGNFFLRRAFASRLHSPESLFQVCQNIGNVFRAN